MRVVVSVGEPPANSNGRHENFGRGDLSFHLPYDKKIWLDQLALKSGTTWSFMRESFGCALEGAALKVKVINS